MFCRENDFVNNVEECEPKPLEQIILNKTKNKLPLWKRGLSPSMRQLSGNLLKDLRNESANIGEWFRPLCEPHTFKDNLRQVSVTRAFPQLISPQIVGSGESELSLSLELIWNVLVEVGTLCRLDSFQGSYRGTLMLKQDTVNHKVLAQCEARHCVIYKWRL